MNVLKICLFVFSWIVISYSQQFTNWKNYTDMKAIRDVFTSSNAVWAATGGGAFFYSGSDDSFTTINKAEGLKGIDLTTVQGDNLRNIWFGSSNGIIDIYNPKENSFKVILDIFNSNNTNKSINDLVLSGDTIIISTDFGVSLVDINTRLFFDTFVKFGDFPSNTRVNNCIKLGLVYTCTDEGVAIQKRNATNLSAPESWNVYRTQDGLPSNKVFKAAEYLSDIIVSTDNGFAKFEDSIWVPILTEFNNYNITDFAITGDSIFILTLNSVFLFYNNQVTNLFTSQYQTYAISYSNNFGIGIATSKGVLQLDDSLLETILIPNGPEANQFPSISVGEDGIFWSASGKDNLGVGFYKYDKTTWTNYNGGNTNILPTNDYYYAYNAPDNTAFLGSWGRGFITVKGDEIKIFNRQNTGIQGIPNAPDFIVITGFGTDTRNNKWILNFAPGNRKTLSMVTPDSLWYHFVNPAEPNINLSSIYNLAIDPSDTKFYSVDYSSSKGLFYFNENKTYDDPSDDRSGFISTADGINGDIREVVVDRRGDVWIGTNEGLLLVNSDGSRLLAALTSSNSALLSNKIQSITVDANAGIVYVGTEEGLTSFETPFIKPLESFDKLFVFPNPFILKDKSKFLTIDGLIRDTDIKILTITGNLITEFSSPGGRTAYWDGTDDNGNLVSSGVYLVVAFDRDGNNILTGKVAVVRD